MKLSFQLRGGPSDKWHGGNREGVKYYFADFDNKFAKTNLWIWGYTPPQWANLGHHVVELAN